MSSRCDSASASSRRAAAPACWRLPVDACFEAAVHEHAAELEEVDAGGVDDRRLRLRIVDRLDELVQLGEMVDVHGGVRRQEAEAAVLDLAADGGGDRVRNPARVDG